MMKLIRWIPLFWNLREIQKFWKRRKSSWLINWVRVPKRTRIVQLRCMRYSFCIFLLVIIWLENSFDWISWSINRCYSSIRDWLRKKPLSINKRRSRYPSCRNTAINSNSRWCKGRTSLNIINNWRPM